LIDSHVSLLDISVNLILVVQEFKDREDISRVSDTYPQGQLASYLNGIFNRAVSSSTEDKIDVLEKQVVGAEQPVAYNLC
jgi:hypothetical protein